MSDQCKHCSLRNQFYNCRQAECFQHENWYALEMIKENDRLRYLLTRIMSDLPSRRDWLDPDLERIARSAIEEEGVIENDWIKEHVKLKADSERLKRLIAIVVANALIAPDISMKGETDCYYVPMDDIDALKETT